MHYVVVIVVISLFLHCIFKTYSSIQLSSRKCMCNKLSVQCSIDNQITAYVWAPAVLISLTGYDVRRGFSGSKFEPQNLLYRGIPVLPIPMYTVALQFKPSLRIFFRTNNIAQ